jgi:hypothetical protein
MDVAVADAAKDLRPDANVTFARHEPGAGALCVLKRYTGSHVMSQAHYKIVEHDGGWTYRLGDVFAETYPTHDAALAAARVVAAEQRLSGETVPISWQDADGAWHEEIASGDDRPETDVSEG